MAAIHSLLNPLPESESHAFQLPSPSPSTHDTGFSSPTYSRKKQKLCKDAAVFVKGKIHGECRYPAYEDHDEFLAVYHQQHEIRPLGRIMEYPRHVPYNSEKKAFLQKTQRDGFEVFHYEFKALGEDKVHTMMWDYNIGLVRTTPLFKCTGYSKTTPAKMLNRNPGLREICHSITGGSLVAQGYWMPFEAAKAIAATFCWKIRYALTPVFGPDFPTMCIRPECERFGNMIIDPAITQRCTEEATFYRQLEVQTTTRARSRTRTPLTPASPSMPRPVKQLRRKAHHLVGAGSGYTSDSSFEDNYSASSLSPTIPYCNTWTPANTPRSVGPLLHTRVASRPDTPAAIPAATPAEAPEAEDAEVNSTDSASMSSTTSLLLKSGPDARDDDADEEYDNCDGASSDSSSVAVSKLYETRAKKPDFPSLSDKKAAYLLLKLSMEASLTETPRVAKRRASA